MAIVTLRNVSLAYGDGQILADASLTLDKGQRIGVVGRNGEGKSTLLKIIAGRVAPDRGEVHIREELRIMLLEQDPDIDGRTTVYGHVASGFGKAGDLLAEYRHLVRDPEPGPETLEKTRILQNELTDIDGWGLHGIIDAMIGTLSLEPAAPMASLSGGSLKRAAIARAFVSEPDVLLLDEPTNHLDLASILWLEKQVGQFSGTILFVTHDREFLDHLATHIVEIDRGMLTVWPGNYHRYRERKAALTEAEDRRNREFDRQLAREERWIREGIKARRRRNEGRIRRLLEMRRVRAERRIRPGNVRLEIEQHERTGKRVIEARNISYAIDDRPIVENFSARIVRGDRIGLIGPNGIGKSTLLNLLLKTLEPDSGTVRHGTRIQPARFDQFRTEIEGDKTVVDTVGQGRESITVNGRSRHIISYLSDFLFTSRRAMSPVSSLSGGERARVLLALLFSKPVNLLAMDEPTNDLDTDTLELLEELLLDFQGTLLLVTHDRRFMDNVATSTLGFEGNGQIREYVGGYSDWLRQTDGKSRDDGAAAPGPGSGDHEAQGPMPRPVARKRTKPSYREQQELKQLPERIETLENRQQELSQLVSSSDFYRQERERIREVNRELTEVEAELERCFERWSELESRFA